MQSQILGTKFDFFKSTDGVLGDLNPGPQNPLSYGGPQVHS